MEDPELARGQGHILVSPFRTALSSPGSRGGDPKPGVPNEQKLGHRCLSPLFPLKPVDGVLRALVASER